MFKSAQPLSFGLETQRAVVKRGLYTLMKADGDEYLGSHGSGARKSFDDYEKENKTKKEKGERELATYTLHSSQLPIIHISNRARTIQKKYGNI